MEDKTNRIAGFGTEFQEMVRVVNERLDLWLPSDDQGLCKNLHKSCRYSVLSGGKRIRAVLALITGRMYGADDEALLRLGCSIELIHTYSLIHDDLPAMDDDDFRRGRPANHKVFTEAVAILAGDNLLTLAFSWLYELKNCNVSCEKILEIIKNVADAAGHNGMIGGQILDLEAEKNMVEAEMLETIHSMKTGALLKAPVCCAAIIGGASEKDLSILSGYAEKTGLLFQVKDDILDVEGDPEVLGKTTGADARLQKSTYPALLGLDGAKALALKLLEDARKSLKGLSVDATKLAQMADLIYSRRN